MPVVTYTHYTDKLSLNVRLIGAANPLKHGYQTSGVVDGAYKLFFYIKFRNGIL